MTKPSQRSSKLRKIHKKLPGGRNKLVFKRALTKRKLCPVYGTPLAGVARGTKAQIKKLSKSQKRPERPYGGVLSSKAMRNIFISKARKE